MKGKRAKINSILLQFDFRIFKDVMRRCDISWCNKENVEYIPSIQELEVKAREMLTNAANSETSYCKLSGNGFIARKTASSLELLYVIEAKFA